MKTPVVKEVKIGNETFQEVSKEASAASRILSDLYNDLGKPKDPFSEAGQKLVKVIIAVWEDLYPIESKVWHQEREEHKVAEMDIKEQVHQRTGRSLASYPYPIFKMMAVVFPGFKPAERKNCMKMIKLFPMFKMVNRI